MPTKAEFYLTKEGLETLKDELNDLQTVQRPKLAERLKEAKEGSARNYGTGCRWPNGLLDLGWFLLCTRCVERGDSSSLEASRRCG